MSDTLPAPLTPADCDLDGFDHMPLHCMKLRDSDFAASVSGDAFRAGVLLWAACWHQVPAASLPDNDRVLASLAGFGRFVDRWAEVRAEALHGFTKCDDGRLYHETVAAAALRAWIERLISRLSGGEGNLKRHGENEATRTLVDDTRAALRDTVERLKRLDPDAKAVKKAEERLAPRQEAARPVNKGPQPKRATQKPTSDLGGRGKNDGNGSQLNLTELNSKNPLSPPADDGAGGDDPDLETLSTAPVSADDWAERVKRLHAKAPHLDMTSAGVRNHVPLKLLVERDGIAWRDVFDAVVEIGAAQHSKSNPLRQFTKREIADLAHAKHELRTGEQSNGRRTDRPKGNGREPRGLAGAIAKRMLLAGDDPQRNDGRPRPRSAAEELRDEVRDGASRGENSEAARAGE